MRKNIICLDFDGVINSYTSGWMEADFIPDPPVSGALAFIKSILDDPNLELNIFSSRSNHPGGIRAMQLWLKHWFIKEYGWEIGAGIGHQLMKHSILLPETHPYYYNYFPTQKPPAFVTIDDRALTFTGVFPSLEEINSFKPWNKK